MQCAPQLMCGYGVTDPPRRRIAMTGRRLDWNVEEIVEKQKNLMDILFIIHDFATSAQIDFSTEPIAQIRGVLENLEEVAKEKDSNWQAKKAAGMREYWKQLKEMEQDDTTD
jgi:hypothetical protein